MSWFLIPFVILAGILAWIVIGLFVCWLFARLTRESLDWEDSPGPIIFITVLWPLILVIGLPGWLIYHFLGKSISRSFMWAMKAIRDANKVRPDYE